MCQTFQGTRKEHVLLKEPPSRSKCNAINLTKRCVLSPLLEERFSEPVNHVIPVEKLKRMKKCINT